MKKVSLNKSWDNPRENRIPASARVPASVVIGDVPVAPATVLAPMAGVTDTVFRRFIRDASLFSADVRSGQALSTQVSDSRPGAPGSYAPRSDAIDAEVTNAQSGCGLLMTEFTS